MRAKKVQRLLDDLATMKRGYASEKTGCRDATPSDIAVRLLDEGVRGNSHSPNACPVANYMHANLPIEWALTNVGAIVVAPKRRGLLMRLRKQHTITVRPRWPLIEFIQAFDSKHFAERTTSMRTSLLYQLEHPPEAGEKFYEPHHGWSISDGRSYDEWLAVMRPIWDQPRPPAVERPDAPKNTKEADLAMRRRLGVD